MEDNIYLINPGNHRIWFPEGDNHIPLDFDDVFEGDLEEPIRDMLAIHPNSKDGDHHALVKVCYYFLTKGKSPVWKRFKYIPEKDWCFNRWILNRLRFSLLEKKIADALFSEMEKEEARKKRGDTLDRRLKRTKTKKTEIKEEISRTIVETETEKGYGPEEDGVIDFTGGF